MEKHKIRDRYFGYTHEDIGLAHFGLGDYPASIGAHLEAISYFEKEDMKVMVGKQYTSIANCYSQFALALMNMDSTINRDSILRIAADYHKKAIKIYKESESWVSFVTECGNIGRNYTYFDEDSAAHYYALGFEKCRMLLETARNPESVKQMNQNMASLLGKEGHLLEKQKKYSEGEAKHREALRLYQAIEDSAGLFTAYTNIGNNFDEQQRYQEALPFYQVAHKICLKKKLGARQRILATKNLNQIYEKLLQQSPVYKDSAYKFLKERYRIEQEENIRDKEGNFVKSIISAEQKRTIDLATAQSNFKSNMLWVSGIIILLLFGLFAQLLRLRKSQARESQLKLEALEKVYEEEFRSLAEESQQKLIISQHETQEKVLKQIGRELHDNVQGILATVLRKVEDWAAKNPAPEYSEPSLIMIQEAIDGVRQLSHDLKAVQLKDGLMPAVKELLERTQSLPKSPVFTLKTYNTISLSLPASWELHIYRIFQEAISNILKYAEAKSVEIQFFARGGELVITIEDNGKGFDMETKADGIGLQNIKSRADEMKGKFTITSSDLGTTLFLEIPIEPQNP
ncbi:MAG: sensor histidine kinase [Bacteroidia bacterium]